MRLLVTGGTGFLGSRLLAALAHGPHELRVLARPASATDRVPPRAEIVRSAGIPSGICAGIDAVIYLACCYGRNRESMTEVAEANLLAGIRLLDEARSAGTRVFINAGTSLPAEVSPYALSKRQFSEWGRAWTRGALTFVDLRLEHLYGPGDHAERLTMMLITSCLAGAERVALTAGEQVRDFIHVDDAVSALLAVLERALRGPAEPAEYPIGTGRGTTIRELALLIRRLCHSSTVLDFGALPYRPSEPMRSVADTTALTALGWRPRFDLEAGMEMTIAWTRGRAP